MTNRQILVGAFALALGAGYGAEATAFLSDAACRETQAAFEKTATTLERAVQAFKGIDDPELCVYNCSIPFAWEGRRYVFGRVDPKFRWGVPPWVVLFVETGKDEWTVDPKFHWLQLSDPAVQFIRGEIILTGTHVEKIAGKTAGYVAYFYRGKDPYHLTYFTHGPKRMKDIRPIELPNGRIGVFTRPRGEEVRRKYGSESLIGYVEVDDVEGITPEALEAARPIPGIFGRDEWGGANQAYLLPDGRIGVAGHLAWNRPDDLCPVNNHRRQHYCNISFVFDPKTFTATRPKIVATAGLYGVAGRRPKSPDLDDCAFTSGFVFNDDGTCDVYSGLLDAYEGRVRIRASDVW